MARGQQESGLSASLTVSLRQWKDGDLEPFATMNTDLEIMRYFPRPSIPEGSPLRRQVLYRKTNHSEG